MGPDATDTLFCILISLEADSWVDDGIEDIHQQVDQDEFERKQEHFGLKNRIVPHFHGIHEQTAKAGPIEYLLNHDGTAEQKTELEAHHGHDRDERIAQAVLDDDRPLAQAFGAGRTDVVVLQDLHKRRE